MNELYKLFQSATLEITVAGCANVGSEWKDMVSDFKYIRLYYVRTGSARLTLFDRTLELKAGNMYFIPALTVVSGVCDNEFEHYFIHIVPDIFTEHFFKIFSLMREIPIAPEPADYLFTLVANLWQNQSDYAKITVESALRLIFSHFLKGFEGTAAFRLERFITVFDYIDMHLGEKIYMKDLSALIFMDDVYFSNLFKKVFGVSPQHYILKKKLDKSQMLLTNDELSVAAVADMLNFSDTSAFVNFFKKQTGITPKAFRNKFMQNGR